MDTRKLHRAASAIFGAVPDIERGARVAIDAANMVLKVTEAVGAFREGRAKVVVEDKKAEVTNGRIRW
jgi:hypothetical protein